MVRPLEAAAPARRRQRRGVAAGHGRAAIGRRPRAAGRRRRRLLVPADRRRSAGAARARHRLVHDRGVDGPGSRSRRHRHHRLLSVLDARRGEIRDRVFGVRRYLGVVSVRRGLLRDDGGKIGAGAAPRLSRDARGRTELPASAHGAHHLEFPADRDCAVRHRTRRHHGRDRDGTGRRVRSRQGQQRRPRDVHHPGVPGDDLRQDGDCRRGVHHRARGDRDLRWRQRPLEPVGAGLSALRHSGDADCVAARAVDVSAGNRGLARRLRIPAPGAAHDGPVVTGRSPGGGADDDRRSGSGSPIFCITFPRR